MSMFGGLEGRLLFAVPKKGRLQQPSLDLLEGVDIQFKREHRLDIALVKNHPMALVFLPAADIPTFVGQGRVDLGITGLDQVQEYEVGARAIARERGSSGDFPPGKLLPAGVIIHEKDAGGWVDATIGDPVPAMGSTNATGCEMVMELGFGTCKLQVQVPENGIYKDPKDLVGKNIGTSFDHLTKEYFAKLEAEMDIDPNGTLKTKIMKLSGSVEAACALGVADGIVDLVESGETMKAAKLKQIDTVIESSAILIKSKTPSDPELVDRIAARIQGVITAQKYVLCQYNIPRSKLVDGCKITPGKRAPTITSLGSTLAGEEDWVAVSAMVEKNRIAVAMDDLTVVGAKDILVLNIQNTR